MFEIAMLVFALTAHAQQSGESQNGTQEPQQIVNKAPADLLAGPDVKEDRSTARPSIVNRMFDGSMEDIGPDPQIAAVKKLDLTDQQRETFERIRRERDAAFDKLVRENYSLVVEFSGLQSEEDPLKRAELLEKARVAFEPFRQRGSFLDEFGMALTQEQRQQVEAMVMEFRQAKLQELRAKLGNEAPLPRVAARARLEALGQMVRLSIERQVGLGKQQLEVLAEQLDLTPEQKTRVEAIFQPLAVKRFQEIPVTAAERTQALRSLNQELTPPQRRKLLQLMVDDLRNTDSAAKRER